MIQSLRRKFVLINMSFVTLVLLIVFALFCFSSYQRLERDSHDAMRMCLSRPEENTNPKFKFGGKHPEKPFQVLPVFCVNLDGNGRLISITGDNAQLSEETAMEAVQMVQESGKQDGILRKLNVRFMTRKVEDGMKIAFVDRSSEVKFMKNLVVTSLLVGTGGLAAFFAISLFLSSWVLRPVERAWEQQRQFVADASHELKTPLTVILANVGILLLHKNDTVEEQIKWVTYIKTEADRMKKLVEDLLFLARSDAENKLGEVKRLNFSDLVWSSLLPFESVAFEQGITLDSNIASDIWVEGNEGQLTQLVAILLDNACKYAEEGGRVLLELDRIQDKIKLSVNNSGKVIPKENMEHLFERFYRADQSRTREKGGYGLGLAIAKSITENHKGKIMVESTQKNGTTFLVWLFESLPLVHKGDSLCK